ncbi:MAG TPA: TonB-dependent receptor [Flavipsychrobacter sp.]|nr:TonB-dependent receptor [Flavipsychrobacter sp.]
MAQNNLKQLNKCALTLKCSFVLLLMILSSFASAQTLTQTVYGTITDAESKKPLVGITVLLVSNTQINGVTDTNGRYKIIGVPVGRQSFQYTMMGYETRTISEVLVTSGKEAELNISMSESAHQLGEASVSARRNKARPLNDFATVSARSFSAEDTRRYPASVADPARMALNFAGVSSNGDINNDIVVRGNSPDGVLWRLEGIEIPNPNHFSNLGNSGGAISMLNANTLGTSDFYTGAFPPEMGDALAGVFDLNFRNGNINENEQSIQVGTLGVEGAAEGPFKKGGQASYIIDYRYSTLALLHNVLGISNIPTYQDVSLKLNFPTKKAGTFSVFGLGGLDASTQDPAKDSTKWTDDNPNIKSDYKGNLGVLGVSHQYFVSPNAYIKTVVSGSYISTKGYTDTLNPGDGYNNVPIEHTNVKNTALRASILFNDKINSRNTIRTGIVAQQLGYDLLESDYIFDTRKWDSILNGSGNTEMYDGYVQWKYRMSDRLTLVSGVHGSYYALNKKYSIEPRAAISYQMGSNTLTFATGLYSKPADISTYLFQNEQQRLANIYPNKDLDLLRAYHAVLGYDCALPFKTRMKIETYYQRLYNIPVEKDDASGFSLLNIQDVFDLVGTNGLASKGTGNNYGIDLTLDRPFANNYYALLTSSLFKSNYTAYNGQTYEGRFDRRFQLNVIAGKEYNISRDGRKILGVSGKVLYSGGERESPIDLQASITNGIEELVPNQYYTHTTPSYFRVDGSLYYKISNKKVTHNFDIDIQNITNRKNYYFTAFDGSDNKIKVIKQTGIIPIISYRIEFHNL